MRRIVLLAVLVLVPPLVWASFAAGGKPSGGASTGVLPELRTVVPRHLGIQNQQQREYLRFANGIANLGPGDLRLRPDPPPRTADTLTTTAVQEILDANRNIASEHVAGTFEYHPEHNHWHIGDVAKFDVRVGSATGPLLVNDRGVSVSIKTTFCLIDWYQLEGNSNTKERLYWDCATSFQGIAPGWVDQYHQSLDGQKVDISGANPGLYYLVSTANPERRFLEIDYTNNTAWTSFRLTRDSNGNAKIAVVGNSPCETPGLCGVGVPNR